MRICAVMKYPPIQGGVSARCYWIARALAQRGHQVHVVTNAAEVEDDHRIWIPSADRDLLEAEFAGGGRVTVTSSGMQRRAVAHIPRSNPFVTKLSSLATEVIRREGCEVVFSYYYEPYGLGAHLAATWTGIPHVVQHAGSDHGRLLNHPELSAAYREMLRRARIVVTTNRTAEGLGVPRARLARANVSFLPEGRFTPAAAPMDVDAMISSLSWHPFVRNTAPLPPGVPTVGVLGKVGEFKGSYELIAALAGLRARGHRVNLLAMVGGGDRDRFLAAVDASGLGEGTWTLPLLPHWHVPSFLRRCTAVCFLERRFPIEAHRPGIPQEIMACGVCAVLSREIADKQPFRRELRHGENVLVVDNPSNADELAAVLESVARDPERARTIGLAGASLVDPGGTEELGKVYEGLLQAAVDQHRASRSSTPPHRSTVDREQVRAFLARHAPATVRLLAREIENAPLDDGSDAETGAATLAYHLLNRLCREHEGDRAPRWEIARFERDLLWLVVDLEGPSGTPQFPHSTGLLARRSAAGRDEEPKPVRSNWMRFAEHPAGIEDMVAAVLGMATTENRTGSDRPQAQAGTNAERLVFAFHKRGDLARRVYRLNHATRQLIELCDGSRSIGEIDAALVERGIDPMERIRETVDRLVHDGVLRLQQNSR